MELGFSLQGVLQGLQELLLKTKYFLDVSEESVNFSVREEGFFL